MAITANREAKKVTLVIIEPCFIEGEPYQVGESIEAEADEALNLVGSGRARLDTDEARAAVDAGQPTKKK